MSPILKSERIERRQNVAFLKKILAELGNGAATVTFDDNKYTIISSDDKKYELTNTHSDITIREFNKDIPGGVRVVNKEGRRVVFFAKCLEAGLTNAFILPVDFSDKVKLAKFKLLAYVSAKQVAAKAFKSDIKLINKILTILSDKSTNVSLEHETAVMKKYKMHSVQNGHIYDTVIEFDGTIVNFCENGYKCSIDSYGYTGVKLKCLQQKLQKKTNPQVPLMPRLKNRQYQ